MDTLSIDEVGGMSTDSGFGEGSRGDRFQTSFNDSNYGELSSDEITTGFYHPPVPSGPKVRFKVEFRELRTSTLLYTKDVTELDSTKRHQMYEGPVFDVVDVNYTSETKDTQKSEKTAGRSGKPDSEPTTSPSVRVTGQQFIRIYSHAIMNALQSVVNYYPYRPIVGDPVDMYEPYPILVHHWEKLEKFREQFNPKTATGDMSKCELNDTYEHLGYLLRFLEQKMGAKVRKEYERWKQPIPKASFEMLWLLLRPGIDVYCDQDDIGSKEPWVMSHVHFRIQNQSWHEYNVRLWCLNGEEHNLRPNEISYKLSRFHGEKPIEDLPIFPCEYLKDHEQRKEKMIERGKRFLSLRQKKCMYFDGEGDAFPRRSYKGYVMLDPIQQIEDLKIQLPITGDAVDQKPSGMPFCFCDRCSNMESEVTRPAKFFGYDKIELKKTKELTDHQYFICARSTWAFVLGIRQWKLLFLEGFSEPQWDNGLINDLVLKSHYKSMLQNLSRMFIEQQSSSADSGPINNEKSRPTVRPWTADYIENKGKGLVFLLHGKPGVGKTYTAECIAHQVHRPLLSVTCADIGVDPSKVEENLRRWFKMARSWDAIMLLDEADIYMEYRQIHDLKRNNLVAGFLRAIEYYEGILFLTTNRIGTFDEAFLSRLTAIYYPDFSDQERQQIWNNYFDKLERERGEDIYVPESTREYTTSKEVKDLEWNGREIRNAFQIAVNLAQAEGNRDSKGRFLVKRDHIKVTVELSKDFKDYMVSLHKKTESQRAQLLGYRYDAYNAPNAPRQEYY